MADHRPVCLLSNRVHWLYLLWHSGNQRSSYLCSTHRCGWVSNWKTRKRLSAHYVSGWHAVSIGMCGVCVCVCVCVCVWSYKQPLSDYYSSWFWFHVFSRFLWLFVGVSSQGTASQWTCVQSTTMTSSSDTPSRCFTVSMGTCWQTARGRDGWVLLDMTCRVWRPASF